MYSGGAGTFGAVRASLRVDAIRVQTSVINAIRAHLAEFGIVAPVGRQGVEQLLGVAADANESSPKK